MFSGDKHLQLGFFLHIVSENTCHRHAVGVMDIEIMHFNIYYKRPHLFVNCIENTGIKN